MRGEETGKGGEGGRGGEGKGGEGVGEGFPCCSRSPIALTAPPPLLSVSTHWTQVAGDMLYDHDFDLSQVLKYFSIKKGNLAVYYEMEDGENPQTRGIVEVDPASNRFAASLWSCGTPAHILW